MTGGGARTDARDTSDDGHAASAPPAPEDDRAAGGTRGSRRRGTVVLAVLVVAVTLLVAAITAARDGTGATHQRVARPPRQAAPTATTVAVTTSTTPSAAPSTTGAPPGTTAAPTGGTLDINDLAVGDCFDAEADLSGLRRRGCGQAHQYELYAVSLLADGPYPGDAAVERAAERACLRAFGPYTGQNPVDGNRLTWYYAWPDRDLWRDGDRGVYCYLGADGRRLSGSARYQPQA